MRSISPSRLPGSSGSPTRRNFLALSGSSLLLGGLGVPAAGFASTLLAQASSGSSQEFQPQRGQSGKDVIWIPTPDKLVHRMLSLAQVTPQDYVIDLGAGDGKIVIAAVRDFKARGLGIEYNPDMVEHARRNAQAAGVSDRARFEKADIFESDFSPATVITMYLLPHLNMRLRHRLMALKPGTRIVSHEFRLGNWTPDETSRVGSASAHLWLVPANFGGDWQLSYPQRNGQATAKLSVEQTFQNFRGRIVFDDFETGFREPKVAGDRVRFAFTDEDGRVRNFDGRVDGDKVSGTVHDGNASAPFTATRIGNAPAIGGSAPAQDIEIYEN